MAMDLDDDGDDDDDDEETLQLKLEEIQARLKLKKLKEARAKAAGQEAQEIAQGARSPAARKQFARPTTPEAGERAQSATQNLIQVAASPIRKVQAPQEHRSPSRVLLGIDKGLKAKDVSLKRAPSQKRVQGAETGGYLRTSRTQSGADQAAEIERPMSFNERLSMARTDEAAKQERQQRISSMRSNAFGITKEQMEVFKKEAVEIPNEPLQAPGFTRDDIVPVSQKTWTQTSNHGPSSLVPAEEGEPTEKTKSTKPHWGHSEGFESFSNLFLSRRFIGKETLVRQFTGKKTFSMKSLLKLVVAPDFALPDVEEDIVTFGIVAKKSEPRAHDRGGKGSEGREKYMVITLVDLQYEMNLFLFNSGFTRYYKLPVGTVIAILNPTVLPPPKGKINTGAFCLVVNSDDDCIVELGLSRDLSHCKTVKADGQPCASWVNKKKSEFCEYHTNEVVKKTRATRLEMNTSAFGGYNAKPKHNSRDSNLKKTNSTDYGYESASHVFASRTHSAADLIDGKHRTAADRQERKENIRRSLAAKEQEREIMKKLGKIGNSAGKEYMKYSGSQGAPGPVEGGESSGQPSDELPAKPDAAALGLIGRSNAAIHLSPIKRKRVDSVQSGAGSSVASGTRGGPTSFGWGGGLRDKLSRMKDGEKLQKDKVKSPDEVLAGGPVRKKTRFITEKGIREAGRESLGMDLSERQVQLDDDDDDELVILR